MRKLYVPLVVDYATDDKIIEAGPLAELLYVRSLAFAKRTQTDGAIKTSQLGAVALGISTPAKHAARLVEVGLWITTGAGWQIAAWSKHNKAMSQLDAETVAGKKANHKRWKHPGSFEMCLICRPDRGSESDPIGLPIGGESESKDDREREDEREENGSTYDDNNTSDPPPVSSSSFDEVVRILVAVAELNTKPLNPGGFRRTVAETTTAESGAQIRRLLGSGLSSQQVAERIAGNGPYVRVAMRRLGLPTIDRSDDRTTDPAWAS